MSQKNRFVHTSRSDRWLQLRRLAWLAPLISFVRVWQEYHTYFVEDIVGASSFAIGLLYVVVTIACMVFIDAFVPFFLWWFVCMLLISLGWCTAVARDASCTW